MHLIHLPPGTPELSPAYFPWAQNTRPKNHGHTVLCRVSAADPGDRMADWELSPPLPSISGSITCMSLARERVRIQIAASIECVSLLHHSKVKKSLSQS